MSKRTREEEGLALVLASPECFPSSAALIFCRCVCRKPPRSGGMTLTLKSIARAAVGWSGPYIQYSFNPLWLSRLHREVDGPLTALERSRCLAWDMNVTL